MAHPSRRKLAGRGDGWAGMSNVQRPPRCRTLG
jgi:hypothetical protein